MPQLRDSRSRISMSDLPQADPSLRRIFGIETEYGISVTGAEREPDPGTVAMLMFRPVVAATRSTNTYTANGSRLYLDVGSHPEYATAEATRPIDALRMDAAGERTMRRMALDAQELVRSEYGANARVHLYKNNVDSAGHSFGCHENYLVRRDIPLSLLGRELIPFLITRQLYTGAGTWAADGSFRLSQRADFLDDAISSSTTRSRPMINTRDEPLANSDMYRRLHVILGDSNRSQIATWMKLTCTHLVLCILEYAVHHGLETGLQGMELADPGKAIKIVARDMTGTVPLDMADGTRKCALEIQGVYLREADRFVREHGDDVALDVADAPECLELWAKALDSVHFADITELSSWVDWAAKYRFVQSMKLRHPDLGAARIRQFDLDYHDVANGHIFESLVAHDQMRLMLDDASVDAALDTPPADTRAALRGAFVAAAGKTPGCTWSADWTHVAASVDGRQAETQLLDPFDPTPTPGYERVMELLQAAKTA
ncbi:Pup--protein ligase [Pseudoscardovia radai]|uniref:Pup--protein ligase n=1 Tax=Pseudoscardovia radai TaxID=987066 RepID=A0A261EXI0_9BIFI|nr:proteasome accessory factor PafA2 family protein [Pseudoscardovia radai]OZG51545.1 Pup--protein ligase [Pseudoscardovia radai]